MAKQTNLNPDFRGHPDRAENERTGFSRFVGVREEYDIAPGGVLIGRGNFARWYAPSAHPELPQFVAKLAEADEAALLAFAKTWGVLGFTGLTRDPIQAMYTWPDGQVTMGGDPLGWMRAHGRTVQLCLQLTEALQKNDAAAIDRLTGHSSLVDMSVSLPTQPGAAFEELLVAKLATIHPLSVHLNAPAFDRARKVRAGIINPNIAHVRRALLRDDDGGEKSFFVYVAMIEAVYWHLANAAEGGIVMRCKRPGCGALFIQRHRSQEYCAPRGNQRESPCALWVRQRRLGKSGSQRIATDSKTRPIKAAQARGSKRKPLRNRGRRAKST